MELNKYLRRAVIFAIIAILSILTYVGISIADVNTREIGYSAASPIISVIKNEESITLNVMDSDLTVSNDIVNAFKVAMGVCKNSVPIEFKASSVLIEIIGMIVDRFLP